MKRIKLFENFNSNTNSLIDLFEENDFNVHLFEQNNMQCAEIETWTDGGVNMIITLIPFTKEKFIEYVDNFDIDAEIDLYRQDKSYKNRFTIRESLRDFDNYVKRLKEIVEEI